ncbi:FAD-binding oxidoreductase [Frigidibacter sp. RF13]|uniref:NAD(P)/FAD-dependent oxidoreductase n=1 Tax=Frigidibacter sp. RF13 TaxID=2997340 RepID=UPI00226E5C0E|nr:FAD-binding oxidoreductase [Frigidibacter sp. RF13]MCY1127645.1 FAD-binding oxidoreductase [Frigidibacter sp. RF13]
MATADIIVMGGGIFGLATAWECARRGARVRVIERDRIGAGSSGGLVGALAPHVPENWNEKKNFQLDSLLMAEGFWAEVRERSGIDPGYARLGRLQPLADTGAVAQAKRRAESARTLWRGAADWRVERGEDDWRGQSPTGLWIHDSLSARLHPRQAAAALAAAIRETGGEVIEMRGRLDRPVEPAGKVLWATGAQGLADLSTDLCRPVGTGVKGQAALLACAAETQPQLFVDGLHIVPHGDGTVAVGSTSERAWQDDSATDDQLDGLIDRARAACPMLTDASVIDRWAGIRPRASTRAPLLGAWPGREGHYVANGGFKIGFGMAPRVAEVMADLILEGRDAIPAGFRLR